MLERSKRSAGLRTLLQSPRAACAAVFGLALVLSGCFIAVSLYYNHGHLVSPLDDVYITLQYAKQTGDGHFLRYNDLGPGVGGTTFLHPVLLGLLYALGAHATMLLACAVAISCLSLAACAAVVCALGSELVDVRVGWLAGFLVAANGPLLWSATTGMETVPFAALLLASLFWYLRESKRARFVATPAIAATAALLRPEGLLFGALISAGILYNLHANRRLRVATASYGLLPIAAAVGLACFYYASSGGFPTTAAKSLTTQPIVYPPFVIHRAADNLINVVSTLGGLPPVQSADVGTGGIGYVFPAAAFFIGIGIACIALTNRKRRGWLGLTCLALLVLLTASAFNSEALSYHLRTELPLLGPLLLLAGIGIFSPAIVASTHRLAWIAVYGVGGLVLAYTLVLLPIWGLRGAEESAGVREQQVSIGHWIHDNLPRGARIGVNDAGAMAYYGAHQTTDLGGLGSPTLAAPGRNGGGSIFEAMEKLPRSELPDYFAVYPGWPGPADLRAGGIIVEPPIQTFDLTTQQPTLLGGQHVGVYKADWSSARSADAPPSMLGQTPRDVIDVADLDSERASGYQAHMAQIGQQATSVLHTQTVAGGRRVTDGGREIIGGESFTAHNLTPNSDVTLVGMTAAKQATPLRVYAGGRLVGTWVLPPSSDWTQQTFKLPAQLVHSGQLSVELVPAQPNYAPFGSYTSFHYWLFQPQAPSR